ncbi:Rossman fold protein, TIGR00730 family [Candidatus Uhrbacteria bacterium RIFCSPLOWO2_12_FULL_47_10]|nr:MAG: Rossman fold protein, TIGR00730 family [Candidatus Uhrbacteria bacterium RIFCSPLOWO2_12_FULL_47_10]
MALKKPPKIPEPAGQPPPQPPSQKIDFRHEGSWRIFRIMSEFIDGFQFLGDLKKEVSFFGSARFTEKNPHYQEALKLARMLGKSGFTVVTGGGPGIMEAANRGAVESGAESVGINIQLPKEQRVNKYVKRGIGFHYFFTRRVMLSASAQAYIFFPGGFGTLDEFFELVTLIQTKKMERIPIILVGRDYWGTLFQWMEDWVLKTHHAISAEDLKICKLVSSVEEAFEIIKKSKEREYF